MIIVRDLTQFARGAAGAAICGCGIVSLVLAGWIALAASGTARAQTSATTLAVVTSLTGAFETYGKPFLDGARMAVDEANAAGAGATILLEMHDDRSSDDGAREAATKLVRGEAVIAVGPVLTTSAIATGPIFAEAGLPAIVSTAHGDAVTDAATTFRAVFSTSDMGDSLAAYLRHALGGSRAVVVFRDNGFGRPIAEGFKRTADQLGIATSLMAFKNDTDREVAALLAAAEPDRPAIVLGMLDADAQPVLVTLRRQGVKAPILGPSALAGESFAKVFANLPEERLERGFFTNGLYTASPVMIDSANSETLAFAARFRQRYAQDPSWTAVQAYDATRLAIAAIRGGAERQRGADPRARRAAVLDAVTAFDGPANALPGLTGAVWFTPERARPLAIRVGRFHQGLFESAPVQLVPVVRPDPAEIASGGLLDIGGGRFARRQQVVYTGIFINEIPRVDIAQSTFTADFYVWVRFARGMGRGDSDPTEIEFPDLVRGNFDGKRPSASRELDDGTTYRLWRLRGDFKNDFALQRYPADEQNLSIRLFHARAASDRLVYALDRRSFDLASPTVDAGPVSAASVSPTAFRNLSQWDALRTGQRRDSLVTQSALGDPGLVGAERVRELSGFVATIELRRRVLATLAKTLLPLGLMALIMYASLHFPAALVKEKVTVAISGALSGAVLLSSINSQLGNVGYVIAVEYGFYVFFTLCLLCIVAVLVSERLRAAKLTERANVVDRWGRYLFVLGLLTTILVAWIAVAGGVGAH